MIRERLESQRNEKDLQKYGRISLSTIGGNEKRSSRSVRRSMSAQPKFFASFHQSLLSIVKQNNEFRSKYGVQSISGISTQKGRPQTAATHKRNSDFRTLDGRSYNRSNSFASISQTLKKRKKNFKKINDVELKQGANENGNVLFSDIPKGIYLIEVIENSSFNYTQKEVNLAQLEESDGAWTVYVPLERHITTYTSIYVIKNSKNCENFDKNQGERQFFTNWIIKAVEVNKVREVDSDGEGDEPEFDFVYDNREKCYKWPLHPGKYMITVLGEDIKEYNEVIKVKDQDILKDVVPDKAH